VLSSGIREFRSQFLDWLTLNTEHCEQSKQFDTNLLKLSYNSKTTKSKEIFLIQ